MTSRPDHADIDLLVDAIEQQVIDVEDSRAYQRALSDLASRAAEVVALRAELAVRKQGEVHWHEQYLTTNEELKRERAAREAAERDKRQLERDLALSDDALKATAERAEAAERERDALGHGRTGWPEADAWRRRAEAAEAREQQLREALRDVRELYGGVERERGVGSLAAIDGRTAREIRVRVRAALASGQPADTPAVEYAYLIERVHEGSPVWMKHDATWTSDASEARRFVSQEEAGRVIAATRADARVVEHGWFAALASGQPADSQENPA